jgi:signal transduction histidine kinase
MHLVANRFTIARILACLLLTCLDCSTAWAAEQKHLAEPKRVMILHSFGRDFKPWSEYAKAIRAELDRQSRWPLNLHEYSLEIAGSGDENPEGPFVDYLHAVFANRPLDLIVSIGAPAATFVQRHRQYLFRTTPMLLTVVDQRRVQYSVLTENDAVVAVAIDYAGAIANILRVLPDTNHVAVVVGSSPIEEYWREEIAREAEPYKNRVAFTWYSDLSFEDILKHAAALPPRSAIFWELMIVDAAGVVHEEGKALSRLHAAANAPIFSYTDAFFGREIVGGPHVPVLEHGQRVAEVAVRILNGEKAGDIKVPPIGFAAPKFDWREMQRWGISKSALPPGSSIHFRDPSVWERYRTEIMLMLTLVLVQAVLIGWLLHEHRRRHLAEVQSRDSMAELTYMNRRAAVGELSASIAHEVNQPLTGIVTRASAALRWLRREQPDLARAEAALQQIVEAGQRASGIVGSVRAMFRKEVNERARINLNEIVLAVLAIVRIDMRTAGIDLQAQLQDQLPAVVGDNIQLQQVLLNLVMNAIEAMRSVQIRQLRVQTGQPKPGLVIVSIGDTGPGIDASQLDQIFKPLFTTKSRGMGMGLAICQSIIEAHGGRIWVSGAPNGGAIFQFELPTGEADALAGPVSTVVDLAPLPILHTKS